MTTTEWVRVGAGESTPTLRLFCFAHAGGGAAAYQAWRGAFGAGVQVCPIVLPGREHRRREPASTSVVEIIDGLTEGVEGLLDIPVALFGHSLGSVVAFEFARRLAAEGRPPEMLLVSGRRAPHLPARRAAMHDLDDVAFADSLRRLNGTPEAVLRDPALMRLLTPTLRADFRLAETYAPLPGRILDVPVVAYRGLDDPEVDAEELRAWGHVTTQRFETREFPGDHFYLLPPSQALLADIARRIGS